MLLLYAIAAGLLLGKLFGGRLDGLTVTQFRMWPLALAGLIFQLVLFSEPVAERIGQLGPVLYVGSSLLVLFALVWDLHLPGFSLIALGAAANLLAIVANGGHMPSSPEAWAALNGVAALPTDDYSNSALMGAETRFAFLGDIFVLPRPVPFANVFSIGDVLIGLGAIVYLVRQMRVRPDAVPARPASTGRAPVGLP